MARTVDQGVADSPPRHRWIWFLGLWLSGVAAVSATSLLLRWLLLG
jgi:hypothetical protein